MAIGKTYAYAYIYQAGYLCVHTDLSKPSRFAMALHHVLASRYRKGSPSNKRESTFWSDMVSFATNDMREGAAYTWTVAPLRLQEFLHESIR